MNHTASVTRSYNGSYIPALFQKLLPFLGILQLVTPVVSLQTRFSKGIAKDIKTESA